MLWVISTMLSLAFLYTHAINRISLWREADHVLHWPYKSPFLSSEENA